MYMYIFVAQEKLVRLPNSFLCYSLLREPDQLPPVAPPPFVKNGYVTFGRSVARTTRPVQQCVSKCEHVIQMQREACECLFLVDNEYDNTSNACV